MKEKEEMSSWRSERGIERNREGKFILVRN